MAILYLTSQTTKPDKYWSLRDNGKPGFEANTLVHLSLQNINQTLLITIRSSRFGLLKPGEEVCIVSICYTVEPVLHSTVLPASLWGRGLICMYTQVLFSFHSRQLCVCLEQILKHDFPERWTSVIREVYDFLSSENQATWLGSLMALYQLSKKYR